jgi:hypothetical protein
VSNDSTLRRLDELLRRLRISGARTILLKVPTRLTPIKGSVEMASEVVPEVQAEIDAILTALGVTSDDFIIQVARFYEAPKPNDGNKPKPVPGPVLVGVT